MTRSVFILLIALFLLSPCAVGRDNLDSLRQELKTSKGIDRALILKQLARTYEAIDPEERMKYSREELDLAEKYDIDSLKGHGNLHIGMSFFYFGEPDSSLDYFNKALVYFKKIGDDSRIGAVLNNLGVLAKRAGYYDESIKYMIETIKYKEKSKDSVGLANVFDNLGATLYEIDEYKKAFEYFKTSNKIWLLIGDSLNLMDNYRNLSAATLGLALRSFHEDVPNDKILFTIIDEEKADPIVKKYLRETKEYQERFLALAKNVGDSLAMGIAYQHLGSYYSNTGKFRKALDNYEISYELLKKHDRNKRDFFKSIINYASVYIRMGNYKKAEKLLTDLLPGVQEKGFFELELDVFSHLKDINVIYGNFQKAYEYNEVFNILRDSIFSQEKIRYTKELERKYQTEKKEALLQASLAKEKALEGKNAALLRERIFLFIAIGLLAVILAIIAGLFRYKTRMNKVLSEKNSQLAKLNEELEESHRELKEVNDTKDKFFSIIAHDLRNPISSFKQITETISNDYDYFDDDQKKEFFGLMKESSIRLNSLLENLLTWSRSQRGVISAKKAIYKIREITDATLGQLHTQAAAKKIQMINNVPEQTIGLVDPNLTSTIIRNIASNAIKYSPENSKIEVNYIGDSGDFGVLEIRDFGTGMDEKTASELFLLDKGRSCPGTAGEEGTGLGLIICKEFVEKQGGKIWAESEPGKGSSFKFTFKKIEKIA